MNRKRVFVVDVDPGMIRAIERLLRRHGYEPVLFESAEAFENCTDFKEALCLVLDINLDSGRSGIELRHRLKQAGHDVPVIYITGNDNSAVRRAAVESGCLAYLLKPVAARWLIGLIGSSSGLGPA